MAIRGNTKFKLTLIARLLTKKKQTNSTDDQICGACHQKVIVSGMLQKIETNDRNGCLLLSSRFPYRLSQHSGSYIQHSLVQKRFQNLICILSNAGHMPHLLRHEA